MARKLLHWIKKITLVFLLKMLNKILLNNCATTVAQAAPIIPNLGIMNKFNPTFTNAPEIVL